MTPLLRRSSFLLVALALFVGAPLQSHAQQSPDNLGEALNTIGQSYADSYTQPVTDALGGGLNAGLFRTASFDGTGLVPVLDVYVGVSAMGTFTAGSQSSFQPEDESIEGIGNDQTMIRYPSKAPTVFGEEEAPPDAYIDYDGDRTNDVEDTDVSLPPGLINTSIAPLAVPQVGVGTVLGTDAQLRYLPETDISSYGSVSVFGLSVRHSLSQYIPLSPVALSVQGTWQSIALSGTTQDDVLEASGWALNAQISKSVPVLPVTFYGGLQYEKFTVDVNYTFEAEGRNNTTVTKDISLSQEAQNNFRALGGVSISLLFLRINADYALGANNVASVGVGVIL